MSAEQYKMRDQKKEQRAPEKQKLLDGNRKAVESERVRLEQRREQKTPAI